MAKPLVLIVLLTTGGVVEYLANGIRNLCILGDSGKDLIAEEDSLRPPCTSSHVNDRQLLRPLIRSFVKVVGKRFVVWLIWR